MNAKLVSNVVRCLCSVVFLVTCSTSARTEAASYQKRDGTIVDPILDTSANPHSYSGNNLEPQTDLTGAYLTNANLANAKLDRRDPEKRGPDQREPDQRALGRREPIRRGPDVRRPYPRGPVPREPDQREPDQRGSVRLGPDPRGVRRNQHRQSLLLREHDTSTWIRSFCSRLDLSTLLRLYPGRCLRPGRH